MRYFDVQYVIAPDFPVVLYYCWRMRGGSAVHREQYPQFLMGECELRPHDLLDERYKVRYAVYSHSFGRSRYNYQVSGGKPVKRQHSLSRRRINEDKVVFIFSGLSMADNFCSS